MQMLLLVRRPVHADSAMSHCPLGRLRRILPLVIICLGFVSSLSSQTSTTQTPPRTIVTTDPELDDSNSLVRFLLYSNEVTTEGLVYASSQFHWRGDGKGTLFSVPGREYSRRDVSGAPGRDERTDDPCPDSGTPSRSRRVRKE